MPGPPDLRPEDCFAPCWRRVGIMLGIAGGVIVLFRLSMGPGFASHWEEAAPARVHEGEPPGPTRAPALAWNGLGFGLAYLAGDGPETRLEMVALTPAGVPGDRRPVLADALDGRIRPRLGFGGDRYRLAWAQNNGLSVAVLDRRLDTGRIIRIPTLGGTVAEICSHPAGGADSFAVAWAERGDGEDGELRYRIARFAPLGELVGAPVEAGRSRHGDPGCGLGWADGRWDLAWSAEDWEDGDARLYVTRFDGSGAIVEQLTAVSAVRASLRPTSVSGRDAGGFAFGLLGRPSGGPVSVVIVDGDGKVTRHPAPVELNHRVVADLAWAGNRTGGVLLWTSIPGADASAAIHLLAWNGEDDGATPTRIGTPGKAASSPDVRWTGREWGVAWTDERGGAAGIRFMRLSGGGRPLEPDVPVAGP